MQFHKVMKSIYVRIKITTYFAVTIVTKAVFIEQAYMNEYVCPGVSEFIGKSLSFYYVI